MSGIVGSKLNIRGSGRIAKLGTDGQVLTSAGAGVSAVYEDAAGGGTSWQSVTTGSTLTAVAGNGYPINTTSNACTVTLPAGSVGDTIEFVDYAGTWDTNVVTLTANGSEKIQSATDDADLNVERQGVKIVYVDATQGWVATTGVNESTGGATAPALRLQPYSVDFLCIAGGGGGAGSYYAGGGGAGGYRNSYLSETSGRGSASETALSLSSGTTYTITIGAGGAAGTQHENGSNGTDSSISGGLITTVTSTGGGGSVEGDGAPFTAGLDGGSGGGAGATDDVGGSGTANQGYDGGGGTTGGANGTTGGGGGAGADGETLTTGADGGDGGAGLESSITGAAVTRGGGASGSAYNGTKGTGGTGGGGTGAQGDGSVTQATAGTANTGGGGGGASHSATNTGGVGGSGVVILRMTTADYTGTYTNAETPIVDGSDTILVFNATGTYTA